MAAARGAFFRVGVGSGTRPKAGQKITIDNLTSAGHGTLSASDVTSVAKLQNVAAAAGGLTLTEVKDTITIPNFSASGGGGFGGGGSGGGARGTFHPPTSVSVDGVEVTGNAAALGPLSSAKLTAGRTLAASDANANVALLNSDYAQSLSTSSSKVTVGSTITVAKTSFKVVGIVSQPASGGAPSVYIPLARAQALGTSGGKSLKGDVNTIYVQTANASDVTSVSKAISALLPGATVTNQSDLANQLTGSVSSAASLASNLGKWLAIAVLVAAFLLASLLTMSAVSRRVREFGTLKALGWTSRRVVRQVMGEALVIGVVGGIVGVGLGFLGSALVGQFASPLTASLGPSTGSATPGGARTFGGGGFGGGGLVACARWRRSPLPARRRADRERAPERAGHRGRHRRGRVAGHRGRPDRRRVWRLAGGQAPAGRGTGAGRMTAIRATTIRTTALAQADRSGTAATRETRHVQADRR